MGRENEILVTPEILRQTAQNLKDLRESMKAIGCNIVVSRGDINK